ncbi:EAL domain-containing protein [Pseudarthrobacter sp. YS3]|uniref:EAL domain-containing protein n=1 Tax=Pseudarthrobacter sp. YS3 TaxID=3453718 RepID=UPI003EEABFE1
MLDAESVLTMFQPIVDLQEHQRCGVEALTRFPAGTGTPDTVFQSAHAAGLGTALEALAGHRAISFLPLIPEGQYLAVNLSPTTAFDLSERVLDAADVDLTRLVLELTEETAVDYDPAIRTRLAPWRERGLRLAIDDAGAGYSSLLPIVELQPDIIKIDKSLISGIATDQYRRSAIRALVSLARDLDAATVAEGIETVADLNTVRDLGISCGQGYLLGRPSPDPAALNSGTRSQAPPALTASQIFR